MIMYDFKHAIGQDSHRFVEVDENGNPKNPDDNKKLILGGVVIPGGRPLKANSDGDVILHALTNAISGITCVNVLGLKADRLCLEQGIRDSRKYLELAMDDLDGWDINHVSFSIECMTPRLAEHLEEIRTSIADILQIPPSSIGITATSGEGLSDFGRGEGIMVFCSITVRLAFGGFSEDLPTGGPLEL